MRALFLDRDGVINKDFGYVYRVKDFMIVPGIIELCKVFRNSNFKIFIVTNQSGIARGYYGISDLLKFNKKNKLKIKPKKLERFAPSGITFGPNNNLYIISARGSLLVIVNQNKSINHIIEMDENTLPQPEGICFDDKGQLYISSEAKENTAKLCVYQLMD